MTELVKLADNLIAALPTSFYGGIMAVRGGLASLPAADVVARDCYDRLLAENDELRKERPVRHGRWVVIAEFTDCVYAQCDQCKITQVFYHNKPLTNYCPNCGAKMDGDGE